MRPWLCFCIVLGLAAGAHAAQVSLTWEAPSPTTGVLLTGYRVHSCSVPKTATTCFPVEIAGPPLPVTPRLFTITGLVPTRSYCYSVVALGTGTPTARSLPSTPLCVVAPTDGALVPPEPMPPTTPPPPTLPPGQGWSACAGEGQTCTFEGTQEVCYGGAGVYVSLMLTGGTPCTNGVFGDPVKNMAKHCYVRALPPQPPGAPRALVGPGQP